MADSGRPRPERLVGRDNADENPERTIPPGRA